MSPTSLTTISSVEQQTYSFPHWSRLIKDNEAFNEKIRTMACSSTAAFFAAGTTTAVFNPLECLRIRWQIIPKNNLIYTNGILKYGKDILKQEGLMHGLWRPGLAPNVAGMALSNGIRFGCYEFVRDALLNASADSSGEIRQKSALHMFVASIVCGGVGYSLSTPFLFLKTVSQAQKGRDGLSLTVNKTSVGTIIENYGFTRLWRGSFPLACRGALLTTGQMLGYDGAKTLAKEEFDVQDGFYLHAACSISSAFGASLLATPADFVMTRYMVNANSKTNNLVSTLQDIIAEGGVLGFWRGWQLTFSRMIPVLFTFSALYEQGRYHLGIGYLS